MSTAFITHPDCLKHDMGAGHPEQPARLTAIEDQLIASGIDAYLQRHEAPLATDYDDYRDAGNGVKAPYTIHIVGPSRPDCATITFERIQLNVAIDDTRFVRPPSTAQ